MATQQKQGNSYQGLFKFLNGGLAGMVATCFVQPIDLIKTRMQLSGEGKGGKQYSSSFGAAVSIFKSEGITGMYNGSVLQIPRLNLPFECFSSSCGICLSSDVSASMPEPGLCLFWVALILVFNDAYLHDFDSFGRFLLRTTFFACYFFS